MTSAAAEKAPPKKVEANDDWYTPVSSIPRIVEKARHAAASRRTHPLSWRKSQLRAVLRLLDENRTAIDSALRADLGQGEMYVDLFEMATAVNMAKFALDRVDEWAATRRVPTPFPTNLTQPVHSELTPYPRGVVLIITPWNFPLNLVLMGLVNAISAGNACVVKPSELSARTSRLLAELIPKYLDPEGVFVVTGDARHSTELLRHRFDAIAFTGGTRVGKVVARAAAEHLTPLLLELGGKNPAIVCDDADVESAAYRIAWGKFAGNMGQFCLNTDYVLVVESLRDQFVSALKRILLEFYGDDPRESPDVGRMISADHARRVVGMVDGTCTVLHGKERHDVEARYVEPTIVEATAKSTIMREEVFGPILAVVTVPTVDAAVQFVHDNYGADGNHPLAMYVFSKSRSNQRKVMDGVPSGMCTVNHVVMHGGNFHLPFGGLGSSGLGAYYGKHGFDFFSHLRGAMVFNNFNASKTDPGNWIIYPPHSGRKLKAFRLIGKVPGVASKIASALTVAAPVLVAIMLYRNPEVIAAVREFNINTIIGWISGLIS